MTYAEGALEAEVERLRREAKRLREELAAERRLGRLAREAHAAVAMAVSGGTTAARVAELETELRLVRLSRPYRLGRAVRRAFHGARRGSKVDRDGGSVRSARASSGPRLPQGKGRPLIFFVPWLTRGGGGDQFVRDLAEAFVRDGRTVAVVVTGPLPSELIDGTDAMRVQTPHVFDGISALPPDARVRFVKALLGGLDAPVIVNVGSSWFYAHLDDLRDAAGEGATFVDQLFNHVGHVPSNVAVSSSLDLTVTAHEGLRRLLVEHYRLQGPVRTIHVGLRRLNSPARRPPNSSPVVAWLGRLSSEKRPLWFVELARELDGRASFVLAGTGPEADEVARAAAGIGSLEVRGFVNNGVTFLAKADLVVLTSEVEGISVVAMEAIALGIPVVSTDVGGLADLIRPGANGELVDPDDPRMLVSTVRALLEEPGRLEALKARVARERLPSEFTLGQMVERFREVLG